ncbi:MAG: DNA primase noncatalytic subunit PriX [Pyrobaculum sp.]
MKRFVEYLETYFTGPLKTARRREVFLAKGDIHNAVYKIRHVVSVEALEGYVTTFIRSDDLIKRWNVLMGVGFLIHDYDDYNYITIRYDRVVYDFDSNDYDAAVKSALNFASMLKQKYGVDSIVFSTGFKGAHVVVPLRRDIDWETYQTLWQQLLVHTDRQYVDYNMLQWNRLDRVPLTYNIKSEGAKFAEIIWPRRFTWDDFTWDALEPLGRVSISIVHMSGQDIVIPSAPPRKQVDGDKNSGGKKRDKWIWHVVECGLPDGRRRFLLHVLIPRLVAQGAQEDEIFAIVHKFIENSCKNHGNCRKIYDSWIRSVIKSAKSHNFGGFTLSAIQRRDIQLHSLIMQCLHQKLQEPAQT